MLNIKQVTEREGEALSGRDDNNPCQSQTEMILSHCTQPKIAQLPLEG